MLLFIELQLAPANFRVQSGDRATVALDFAAALLLQVVDERLEPPFADGPQSIAFAERILKEVVNVILLAKTNGQLPLKIVHYFLIFSA